MYIPIKLKFIFGIALIVLSISVFFYLYFPPLIQETLLEKEKGNAEVIMDVVSVGAGVGLSSNDYYVLSRAISTAKEFPNLNYVVFLDTLNNPIATYNPNKASIDTTLFRSIKEDFVTSSYLILKNPLIHEDKKYGYLFLQYSLDELNQNVARYKNIILLSAILIMVFGTFLAIILATFIASPIKKLVYLSSEVSKGNLEVNVDVRTSDEIGVLGKTFHFMVKNIKSKTEELKRSNKELEAFSYSVSHDLRAPLRAITGYSNILQEDYAPKLDEEGKRLVNTIITNTERMGQLIDDILAFSRLSRKEINRSEVDMKRLFKQVYNDLKNLEPSERNINFILKDMPKALGDPSLLVQVVTNLLSNAIKYSRLEETAIIEVGSKIIDNEPVYYVKDNGTGFDERYKEKLFGVFQRLHKDRDFEGTGVGLAIVHRIVERHGGRIWASSKLGEGTEFFFTLSNQYNIKIK